LTLAKNAQKEFLIGQSSRSHAKYRRPSRKRRKFVPHCCQKNGAATSRQRCKTCRKSRWTTWTCRSCSIGHVAGRGVGLSCRCRCGDIV